MGCELTNVIRFSEVLIPATDSLKLCTIQPGLVDGAMSFFKVSAGDEIYICFGGHVPSSTDYDVKLTDTVLTWDAEHLVQGQIIARSNNGATAKLSGTIHYR